MIFNLILTFYLGFELQKLYQFNLFFRIRSIIADYSEIFNKKKSIIYNDLLKIYIADFIYFIIIIIGLFISNLFLFCTILFLSALQYFIFKNIKNKILRKISFLLDIILSIIILIIIIFSL